MFPEDETQEDFVYGGINIAPHVGWHLEYPWEDNMKEIVGFFSVRGKPGFLFSIKTTNGLDAITAAVLWDEGKFLYKERKTNKGVSLSVVYVPFHVVTKELVIEAVKRVYSQTPWFVDLQPDLMVSEMIALTQIWEEFHSPWIRDKLKKFTGKETTDIKDVGNHNFSGKDDVHDEQ